MNHPPQINTPFLSHDDKEDLGVFKARLTLYRDPGDYDVRVRLYSSAHLVQLDVRKPISGWAVLAFVDHKREHPDVLVLPEYRFVRNHADAESLLLIETLALLPQRSAPRSRAEIAERGERGCYISA